MWNAPTILWYDLTVDQNDLTWNDLTMERKLTSVSIFSVFFSHFWRVIQHLWRFSSALITSTCNSAAKHQLHIELTCMGWYERATSQCVTKLKGRTPAVVLSSYQIEVTLANHFKRLQLTSSAYLKVGMSLIGHRYSLWKYACFWPLHTTSIIVSRRLSRRILSKNSVAVQAQYIMCEKEEGNERRSLKIKFSVFALSFGFFYRLPGSR